MNQNAQTSNMKQQSAQNDNHAENSQILSNLSNLIHKFKLITQLHFTTQGMLKEVNSISQINAELIQHLTEIFKGIREEQQLNNIKSVQSQIDLCNKTIEFFQIKIIDMVEQLVKYEPKVKQNTQTAESLYQQFFIQCSEYMNKSYEHSNKICLLLSQQVHSMSPNHKSVPQPKSSKESHSADYFLLKHLFEKTSQAKKIYQQQIEVYEKDRNELRKQIEKNKAEISNLMNEREQMKEDLNELQQLIENQANQKAKQLINKLIHFKQGGQQNLKDKSSTLEDSQKMGKINRISQFEQQIKLVKNENQCLKLELEELKQKIKEYKNQIYRAGWIISVQNRQINLNYEKIKEAENNSKYTPFSSNVSFNPGKNGTDIQQNSVRWPSPSSMFGSVSSPFKNSRISQQR